MNTSFGSDTRRGFLISVGTAALAAGQPRLLKARPPARMPNILFVMADDLGYADLSCYGRREYRTPNIDGLAEKGTRFLQAYANSAVCSATRTALMTGRYQYRLPVGLEEPLVNRDLGLPPEHPTLPSILQRSGYETCLFGKWHLGDLPKYGPLKSGYDHFWGIREGGVDYFTHEISGRNDLWDNDTNVEMQGYLTELIGDRAVDFVNDRPKDSPPFFMSLHFTAPHWPWEGPGDQAESDRLAQMEGFQPLLHYDGGNMETYAAMVQELDRQVGRVLRALDEKGFAENTIVIFTSDNGGERFSDTWPFSGKKTELLEGGLRIPTIVSWPGHIPAGRTSEQVMVTMDWLPTLLAAVGTSPDPQYTSDGINLLPILRKDAAPPIERKLFWRYHGNHQKACRIGKWKYLKILDNEFLFDVEIDPLERANLKNIYPDIFKLLLHKYSDWERDMLPIDKESFTKTITGREMADHIGAK